MRIHLVPHAKKLALAGAAVLTLSMALTACQVDSGFGFFDSAIVNADGTVSVAGWATTFLGKQMDVTVVSDGKHIPVGAADRYRADVASAYPKQGGNHGFNKAITLAPGIHNLCSYATGDRGTISLLRNCHEVTVPKAESPDRSDPPTPARCTTAGHPEKPVRMVVENSTGHSANEVFVTLTGQNLGAPYPDWDATPRDLINSSVPLSCLPTDTSDPSGNSYYFDLGQGIGAGLLWVSIGKPIPTGANGLPVVQPSTDTADYVFADVEFAYPGQGDVTNVDQFSMPINLTVTDGPNITKTEYSASTCDIVDGVHQALTDYNNTYVSPGGPLSSDYTADWGQVVVKNSDSEITRILSAKARAQQTKLAPGPAGHQNPNPLAPGWPSLKPYLESMKGENLVFEGLFSPAAGTPHHDETGWYHYEGTINPDGQLIMNGTVEADIHTGPDGSGATAGSTMRIDIDGTDTDADGDVVGEDNLATGIYFQNSRYFVDGAARNGLTNGTPEPAAPDDVYNTIYRDIVTALSYGYPGATYGYTNTNFWNSWAPPAAPHGGKAGFATAHPGETQYLGYNLWSATMYQWSDNYNIPYGENYGSGAVNRPSPLIEVPEAGTWKMTIGKPVSDCTDPAA